MSSAGRQRRVKACIACRVRKVKCDLVKPCGACCSIAKPDQCVFSASEDTRNAISQSEEIQRLRKQLHDLKTELPASDASDNSKNMSSRNSASPYSDTTFLDTPTVVEITRSVVPAKIYHTAFLERLLARYAPIESGNLLWLRKVAVYANEDTPLLTSLITAFSTAYCGLEDENHDLQVQAEFSYTNVLLKLQYNLNSPSQCENPEILYATMVASLYELLIKDNIKSWLAYLDGIGRLMIFRGPTCYTLDFEHETFRFYRMFALSLAVLRRQPTFLCSSIWTSVPWQHGYPSKDLTDLVIDHLLEIPTLQHEVDTFHQNSLFGIDPLEEVVTTRQDLKSKAMALLDSLIFWQCTWAKTYPGVQEMLSLCNYSSSSDIPAHEFIPFIDPTQSHAVNLMYTGTIMLFYILAELSSPVPPQKTEALVEFICSHVEQQLLITQSYFGAMRALFPLRVATRFSDLNISSSARLFRCFEKIYTEFGVKTATLTTETLRETARTVNMH